MNLIKENQQTINQECVNTDKLCPTNNDPNSRDLLAYFILFAAECLLLAVGICRVFFELFVYGSSPVLSQFLLLLFLLVTLLYSPPYLYIALAVIVLIVLIIFIRNKKTKTVRKKIRKELPPALVKLRVLSRYMWFLLFTVAFSTGFLFFVSLGNNTFNFNYIDFLMPFLIISIIFLLSKASVKKNRKVFLKNTVIYVICTLLLFVVFAVTGFLGYEKRIPDKSDITNVSVTIKDSSLLKDKTIVLQKDVLRYNDNSLFVSKQEDINLPNPEDNIGIVYDIHSALLKYVPDVHNVPTFLAEPVYVDIQYITKGGKTFSRTYPLSEEQEDFLLNHFAPSDSSLSEHPLLTAIKDFLQ